MGNSEDEAGEEEGAVEWSGKLLGTREVRGTGRTQGNRIRGAGDPHRPVLEWECSVRKRGPPREAGGEGTGCPGELGVYCAEFILNTNVSILFYLIKQTFYF